MLKVMLKPFFKRFIGLFISMAFVSLLSISLLVTFGSTISNLKRTYANYIDEYGNVDEQITTKITKREKLLSVNDIPEVDKVDVRLSIDAYLKKEQRSIVCRLFTYNEEQNKIFKRYVLQETERKPGFGNISIVRKFANNNNFKLGDTIKIGYFGYYLDFYVCEIVETAEGIYPRANNYIWSDNQDFGYIYLSETDLNTALLDFAENIKQRIISDSDFKKYYEKLIEEYGITIPDFREIDENYVADFGNEILANNIEDNQEAEVLKKIEEKIKGQGVTIKSSSVGNLLPYRLYMNNSIRQLNIATVFLPVFFYSVTMIVIGLFMNQIIKVMTPQIGVLMSIGIDKKQIISLFMIFGLLMAIVAGILGVVAGWGLNVLMANVMIKVYSIPIITHAIKPIVCVVAVGLLLIFAELATLLSCLRIFKITPKDATINNESVRKPLPKWLARFIDKAPMNIKLGTNAIAQNPRRFAVSTFAIFASLVLILLTGFFYQAKNEMIAQSVERRMNYDCQIYMTGKEEDDEFLTNMRAQSFVKEAEHCFYTYAKASSTNNVDGVYLECLAIEINSGNLINIPNSNGKGVTKIQEQGVVLTKSDADRLKVKKGDQIGINNISLVITDISYQYFHPITYLSKQQMTDLGIQYVSTYLVDIENDQQNQFLEFVTNNKQQCLTVFTESLAKDLNGIFDSINVFLYIMIAFSLGMSFIILSIMSQNALMEQQRQLSVYRAIGFTVLDISNVWTLQSVLQMISSALFAIPAGAVSAIILFKLCSSASQIYPFVFSWPVIGIALGFVLLVIIACHWIAMGTIGKWNLADNTRCRE